MPEDLVTQAGDDAAASGLDEEESALGHRVSELFPKCVLQLCRKDGLRLRWALVVRRPFLFAVYAQKLSDTKTRP